MNKLSPWIMIVSVMPLVQCTGEPDSDFSISEAGSLSVQIPLTSDECDVTSGLATVDSWNMSEPMATTLALEGDALVGTLADIPAGLGRQLVVQAFNDNDLVVYEGSANVTVVQGQYTEVSLTLNRNYNNCPGLGTVCQATSDCGTGQICDDGHCGVVPYGACSMMVPCLVGYDCVQQGGGSSCLLPCEGTEVCFLDERCWTAEEAEVLDPAIANHCYFNYCGTSSFWDPDGITADAEWIGTCDALGTGDGTCWGPLENSSFGNIGVCLNTSGERVPGWPCDSQAVHGDLSTSCAGGLCSASGICLEVCATDQPDNCQDWSFTGTPTSCDAASQPSIESIAGLCMP